MGRAPARTPRPDVLNEIELLGLRDRQQLKEDRVNQAEDGRVRADPESQRHYDGTRQPRSLKQHPKAVANVLQQVAHLSSFIRI